MKTIVSIEGISCYSYHGCLEEESLIGGQYSVDIAIEKDVEKAVYNDELHDTVDYVIVNKIVTQQMAIRSRLIEHVAGRILKELNHAFPGEKSVTVKIVKYNPPVNGNVHNASITLSETFD